VVDKFYNDKGEVAVVCNNGGWFLKTRKKIIEYLAKEYPLAQPDDEDRFSVQWIAEGKKFTLFTCEVTNEDIVIEYDELPWAVA